MDIALLIKCLCLGDIAYRISQLLRPIPPVENTDDGGHLDGFYGEEREERLYITPGQIRNPKWFIKSGSNDMIDGYLSVGTNKTVSGCWKSGHSHNMAA